MRALVVLVPALAACSAPQNVTPLADFGPMGAWLSVELGPLAPDSGREDVDPRVHVAFSHDRPDCPVFDDDIDATIDGIRPTSFEHGYHEEGGGYGHNDDATCQPPFFSIAKVPPAQPRSTLRLADATAELVMEVERLFVNPALTLASPLVRGRAARIAIDDDRTITEVSAVFWVGDATTATGYDFAPVIDGFGIAMQVPADMPAGAGWLEVRVRLAQPGIICDGFAVCNVAMHGSARLDGAVQ